MKAGDLCTVYILKLELCTSDCTIDDFLRTVMREPSTSKSA
jgi:hypothetical protein